MTAYSRGAAFENRVAHDLGGRGYLAWRSPGSKSPLDVIAVRPGSVLGVQVRVRGNLGPADWNAVWDLCAQYGLVPLLAWRDGRKLVYERLTARKDTPGRKQPKEVFQP